MEDNESFASRNSVSIEVTASLTPGPSENPTRTQDKVQTFHITAPAEGLSLQAAVALTLKLMGSLKP